MSEFVRQLFMVTERRIPPSSSRSPDTSPAGKIGQFHVSPCTFHPKQRPCANQLIERDITTYLAQQSEDQDTDKDRPIYLVVIA